APGGPSRRSSSPRSNGCGGGTINACTANSACAPRSRSRTRTTLTSNQASGDRRTGKLIGTKPRPIQRSSGTRPCGLCRVPAYREVPMSLDPARLDRAVGAVLASAAGDALGSQYEFGPALPDDAPVTFGRGALGHGLGEWTDDT